MDQLLDTLFYVLIPVGGMGSANGDDSFLRDAPAKIFTWINDGPRRGEGD